MLGIARLAHHDVTLRLFVGKGHPRNHVGAEVDEENGDGAQTERDADDDVEKEGDELGGDVCQHVRDRLLQIVEDATA